MWEDAAPKGANTATAPAAPQPVTERSVPSPAAPQKENCLLWVQLLLCAAVLAAVLAVKTLAPQQFRALRAAYTAALAEPGPFLGEERQFVKFAQQAWAGFTQAAKQVLAPLARPESEPAPAAAPPAAPAAELTAVRARLRAKSEKQPPSGCKTDSYLPDFDLAFPLPAATWATSPYGWRTDPVQGAGDDFHTGMDLHADEGTPVLAAADGVVRRAGRGVSYGNYLRVLHANGDETLYAHMQYLFVRAGQSVHAGEVLGTVGHTGNVTGPHLHFELLHEGWRYDPTEALAAAGGIG